MAAAAELGMRNLAPEIHQAAEESQEEVLEVARSAEARLAACIGQSTVQEVDMAELNIVEKVIALEGVELFGSLSPEQLARIGAIAQEVKFPPEKVVLEPAKPVDALYVIVDGAVELSRNGEVLTVARQNEVLGAWALFDESDPMPVTRENGRGHAAAAHRRATISTTCCRTTARSPRRSSPPW